MSRLWIIVSLLLGQPLAQFMAIYTFAGLGNRWLLVCGIGERSEISKLVRSDRESSQLSWLRLNPSCWICSDQNDAMMQQFVWSVRSSMPFDTIHIESWPDGLAAHEMLIDWPPPWILLKVSVYKATTASLLNASRIFSSLYNSISMHGKGRGTISWGNPRASSQLAHDPLTRGRLLKHMLVRQV